MKMKQSKEKKKLWKQAAVFLAALICTTSCFPIAYAKEDDNTVHIQTQEDLKELSENCRLDTWSQNKTIVLENNLALDHTAKDFLPIPSFGGTFEGNNHTISGVSLDAANSRTGFFDTIQANAVVSNLTVTGQVTSNSDGNIVGGFAGKNYGKISSCTFEGTVRGSVSVGGMVGMNETTGQMVNCLFHGTVTGEHYVGGIAGQNTGSLVQCENHGDINTTAVEVSANISDLSLLRTTESVPAGTDIGGITGFSNGIIQSCTNAGNVGYEHMGYNVGGIVGRQSNYVDGCKNTGMIQGRKDVGGIAGQMEPQVTLRYNKDLLDQLWVELDNLQGLTNQAASDAQTGSRNISGSMNQLIANIDQAKNAVNGMSSAITNWGNENIQEVNDISARISWVIRELEPIAAELPNASDQLENASSLLVQAAQAAENLGEQGKPAAAELQLASEDLSNVASSISNCESHLRAALEAAKGFINGEDITVTIQNIQNELDAAASQGKNAVASLESAMTHVRNAQALLSSIGENGVETLDILVQALENLEQGMSSMTAIADQITSVAATLAEKPAISFKPIDSSVTNQGDALNAALSQVITSASGIQGSVSSSSDKLLGDFNAINQQLQTITDLLQQQVKETKEKNASDSFEDVSDSDSDDSTAGKIHGAINNGEVSGDVNVAGIVGSMSVEYDFDPEDDLTKDGTRSLNFQYKTLAVINTCKNNGHICAKKDYAGGVVGRMDLGAVKSCENYGTIESSSGNYIGGIAGLSRATIRNSFAKCTLAGGDYIGGVIGSGEEHTVVSGCYTLIEISKSGRYAGAVSGTETGTFTKNYYVSDSLAGLGRISYAEKAAPLSFQDLSEVKGMPKDMLQFTLRFLVEDKEIKSESFSYGDSFGKEVFPEIPQKDGYYAFWNEEDLSELHFDKTVTAEYRRYVLTLPSQNTRENGRPIFFADGNFDDKATLAVSSLEQTEQIHGREPEELWKLSCSDTSKKSYTIRYLSPEETAKNHEIYIKQDGQWTKADCTAFGSYLIFTVSNPETEIAVLSTFNPLLIGTAITIGIFLLLVLLIFVWRKRNKQNVDCRKSKKRTFPQKAAKHSETQLLSERTKENDQ
jgi:hypothetical protein